MPFIGITFQTYVMQPQAGQTDDRSPDYDLPDSLASYQRSEKTLVVAAMRETDEIVVGMAGGWLLMDSARPDVLLVKTAVVNEPYADTGLDREMIEVLTRFAEQQGILQVYIPVELQRRLEAASGHASPAALSRTFCAASKRFAKWLRGKT
jgi:hypothetical protein